MTFYGKLMAAAAVVASVSMAAPLAIAAEEAPAEEASNFAFGGYLTGASDYIFRGISQTRGDPAVQGALEASYAFHDLFKPYAGVWGSNVDFPFDPGPDKANVEVDLTAGVRGALALAEGYALTYDANVIYYYYPEASVQVANTADGSLYDYGNKWNFLEYGIVPGITTPLGSVQVGLRYSDDFAFSSDDAYFLYAGATIPVPIGAMVPLPISLALSGHYGRQWILDNYNFGTPDYNEWMVGGALTIDPLGLTLAVNWTGTNIDKTRTFDNDDGTDTDDGPLLECFGNANNSICDDTLSFSVIKVF